MVMKTMKESGDKALKVIRAAVALIASEDWTSTVQEHQVGGPDGCGWLVGSGQG